jgi:AsmA protein
MKKIKILARVLFYTLSFLALLVAALHFALVYIAPSDSVKQKIINTVHDQMAADIKIGSISASIFDFHVKNVELDVKEKNIAKIDNLYIHFSLLKLLKGQLKVNRITLENMDIFVVKDKSGKFNFDPILQSPMFQSDPEKEPEEETKKDEGINPLDLLLNSTQLHNCNITYTDEQADMTVILSKTSFDIKSFKFDNSFKIDLFTDVYAKINDMKIKSLKVALSAVANLHEVDLSKAEIKVLSLILRLKDTVIVTKGVISDFNNPKTNIVAKALKLSSKNLSEIAELPDFEIPEITMQTTTNVNLDKSSVNIENFNINLLDSNITAKGNLNYGKKDLEYDINVIINLILENFHKVTKLIHPYNPTGKIEGNVNVTNKESVLSGECLLINISAFTPQLGDFSEINSKIQINTISDIKIPSLTGKLNKYPFKSSASYVMGKEKGSITANLTADRVYGKMSKEYEKEADQKAEQTKQEAAQEPKKEVPANKPAETKSSMTPLDILVTANIKDLDVPFFMGKNINFKMDMQKVTTDLNAVVGTLDLSTDNGIIKDIYKLTESNVVIKGLFLSLKIVSDVINALNVLDILNTLGSAIFSSKDKNENETEMTEEHAQAQQTKIDGKIDFVSFVTSLKFENGKGTFNKCSFVSNLLSFKVGGEMDFKEDKLKMTVNAAPGKHEDDGIMPLTMKIGGTMEEPSGSLSLLGSVTNLVGDALTKNIVSSTLKSGFIKLLGLKKHDENGNEIKEESTENMPDTEVKTSTEVNKN